MGKVTVFPLPCGLAPLVGLADAVFHPDLQPRVLQPSLRYKLPTVMAAPPVLWAEKGWAEMEYHS